MTSSKGFRAVDHELIADAALRTYLDELPPRGAKPGIKSNGRIEWTILAAFILSWSHPSSLAAGKSPNVHSVISLGTGLKCLPYTSLPPNGDVLHDQHAEVLARRGARHWLLQRLEHEVTSAERGGLRFFEHVEERWRLREGVRLHLYVSTLPCGDASNKLLEFQRAAQDQVTGRADAPTPAEWLELHTASNHTVEAAGGSGSGKSVVADVVRGRASSSHASSTIIAPTTTNAVSPHLPSTAGSLRTKPGRPDSPPSISMSCSDKLALWNAPGIGIQGSLLSSLIEPVHIHSITISDHPIRHILPAFPLSSPPSAEELEKQRAKLKQILAEDCQRALQRARARAYGAVNATAEEEIVVGWSSVPFADSREMKLERCWSDFNAGSHSSSSTDAEEPLARELQTFKAHHEPVTCPNSILYIREPTLELERTCTKAAAKVENLATGTRMGAPTKRINPNHPLKPQARSAISKLNFFQSFVAAHHSIMRSSQPETTTTTVKDKKEEEEEVQEAERGEGRITYSEAKRKGTFGRGTLMYRKSKGELLGSKHADSNEEDDDSAVQMMVVEKFLKNARIQTSSIKPSQHLDQQKQDGDQLGQELVEVVQAPPPAAADVEERGGRGIFKGWLRTPIELSRFDLQGRT